MVPPGAKKINITFVPPGTKKINITFVPPGTKFDYRHVTPPGSGYYEKSTPEGSHVYSICAARDQKD
jgi:hypothetical protein